MPLRRERKNRKKRSTSTTRLRVEALDCKEVTKKMPLRREKKIAKKEVPQLRVCVSRHSTGGDGEIRTLELVSELHDFQSCALDQTRRHLRIGRLNTAYDGNNHYTLYCPKNQVFFYLNFK